MAGRKKYPSDYRRWFKVKIDILDDPRLENCSADCFRFYIRLLAMLKRVDSRDGSIELGRRALNACAGREQHRHALRVASEGVVAGLYEMRVDGAQVVITVSKWPEHQELSTADLRTYSDEITDSRAEQSKSRAETPPTEVAVPAAPEQLGLDGGLSGPDVSGFVSMLTGEIPVGLGGETWDTPAEWFEAHREILIGDAQNKSGETGGTKFNGAFRSQLMRYWNHKRPQQAGGKGPRGSETQRRLDEELAEILKGGAKG